VNRLVVHAAGARIANSLDHDGKLWKTQANCGKPRDMAAQGTAAPFRALS